MCVCTRVYVFPCNCTWQFSSTLTVYKFLNVTTMTKLPVSSLWTLILITLSGHMDMEHVPYSPGPNRFIETGITCLESPSPSWQIPGFLGSVQGTIHETHSVDAFVDVFSGHLLVDGVFSLVSTLLCRSHSFRSKLEGLNLFIWWKTSSIFFTRLFILLLLHGKDYFYFFVLYLRKLCYT